jgi:hypothetical protein
MDYFPSAQNVTIFIDGIYIDMSFRLDWKDSQPKVPVYGYNDHVYTRTARGRKLVQGYLVTNFVVPNYLGVLLERGTRKEDMKRGQEFDQFIDALPESSTDKAEAIARELFGAGLSSKDTLDFAWNYRREGPGGTTAYWDENIQPHLDPIESRNERIRMGLIARFAQGKSSLFVPEMSSALEYRAPFDMSIYYHDPDVAPWYVQLEGVEITDVSQTISAAGAEGSSEPVYETTEFIAKKRDTKVVKRHKSSIFQGAGGHRRLVP